MSGESQVKVKTGVLQGDTLAPFLLSLYWTGYSASVTIKNQASVQSQQSQRYPAEKVSNLDFAYDIIELEESLA